MFGKTDRDGAPIVRGESKEQSFLHRSVKLEGQIETSGDLRIEGNLLGILNVGGTATIGPDAEAKGLLRGREIVIHGTVEGTVLAEQRLHLARGARVKADIYCDTLVIDEGVFFHGRSHMGQPIPDPDKLRREMFGDLGSQQPAGIDRRDGTGTRAGASGRVGASKGVADPGPPGREVTEPGSATSVHPPRSPIGELRGERGVSSPGAPRSSAGAVPSPAAAARSGSAPDARSRVRPHGSGTSATEPTGATRRPAGPSQDRPSGSRPSRDEKA